ncbi:MAG: hypothetical protein NWS46_11500, partial [Cyclobacteriaceae bacterium]|nr:hypothetical protein [Cyclobacteriaceae bacterium]
MGQARKLRLLRTENMLSSCLEEQGSQELIIQSQVKVIWNFGLQMMKRREEKKYMNVHFIRDRFSKIIY